MAQGLFTLRQVNQAIRQGAWSAFNPPQWVEYLCVAGGGGASAGRNGLGGGGAGAGGLLTGIVPVTAGTSYTVTVGAGGTGSATSSGAVGTIGVSSVFGSISTTGGGFGKAQTDGNTAGAAGAGGSGAGGTGGSVTPGNGVAGQGNKGAVGFEGTGYPGGGGGGAGTTGLAAISNVAGNGGAGIASAINGTVTTYSGGGGGGSAGGTAGTGGVGGGGAGQNNDTTGTAGTANTGGGGGGGGYSSTGSVGGAGGSGFVVVRYPGTIAFYTGGSVYTINGYVVHRFTSTGTLTPTTPAAATAAPTVIGQAFQGGYYAGMIAANGSGFPTHYLVVAPKASGEASKQWKNVSSNTPGATSYIDGPQNTIDIVADGNATVYPAAHFCNDLVIGGYTDWYMPARNELEVCYYFLKNVTQNNNISSGNKGNNPNAVAPEPISTDYTTTVPAQTTATAFQVGNSEAFDDGTFWSSTGMGNTYPGTDNAWYQGFYSGAPGVQEVYGKTTGFVVRAVRRVAI